MGIIIKPNITIDEIILEADQNADYAANRIINEFGRNIPVIKIDDYVISLGDLREFTFTCRLNSLPSFDFTVSDVQYKIREKLKNKIDKCVVFFGYKDWYIKFNGILKTTYSEVGDDVISLDGTVYNEKIFNNKQISFKDKSVEDILKELCSQTNMGLFTFNNNDLSKKIDYSLMTNESYIEFFDYIIKQYTSNLYSIDGHYYFHVSDIPTLRNQNYDKYSLKFNDGESIGEKDIIFKSVNRNSSDETVEDFKIPIHFYTINSNYSDIHINTNKEYKLFYQSEGSEILKTTSDVGIGTRNENTFNGFKTHKNPYYNDRINKYLSGNIIKIFINGVLFELNPLSVVGVELYLPYTIGNDVRLDEEHSGKKIVIGYEIKYVKATSPKDKINNLTQTIELI